MKVVVAHDCSEHSAKAFEWYFANVHRDSHEVLVFNHLDKPDIPSSFFGGVPVLMYEEVQMMIKDHKEKAQSITTNLKEKCAPYGDKVKVEVETTEEGAGHAIVRKAEEFGAQLIVTGTRGQGKLRRTVLGSVSDYVIHHAKVPVSVCHF